MDKSLKEDKRAFLVYIFAGRAQQLECIFPEAKEIISSDQPESSPVFLSLVKWPHLLIGFTSANIFSQKGEIGEEVGNLERQRQMQRSRDKKSACGREGAWERT